MLNPATSFVAKLRTANGGRGSLPNHCASHLPIAQSLVHQMPGFAPIVSVGNDCKIDKLDDSNLG